MIITEERIHNRSPLTDQELDAIFMPEKDDDGDLMCAARSYGWEDDPDDGDDGDH